MKDETIARNLQKLTDLKNYKVRKEDPNILQWPVRVEDQIIGHVSDLVVNMDKLKAEYVEVSLNSDFQKMNKKPLYALFPLKIISIDGRNKEVWAPRLSILHIENYPSYEWLHLTPEYEDKLNNHCQAILNESEVASDPSSTDKAAEGDNDITLRIKYLEAMKELQAAQTEKEIISLERDLALAQLELEQFTTKGKKKK